MKRAIMLLAPLALVLAAGCGPKYVKKGKVVDVIEQNMVEGKYIQSIGIGAADQSLKSQTQRRSLSRDAAIVKAQYEMLSLIKGVELEGGYTIKRAIETGSVLETRVNDVIKGAEIVNTRYTEDDGAVVILRIPKKRIKKLLGIKFK